MTGVLFLSTIDYVIFVAALLILVMGELIGARVIPSLRRKGSEVRQRQKGMKPVLVAGWLSVFCISYIFALLELAMLPDWFFYVGISFMLVGVAVRQWAIAVLGKYFSTVIGVVDGQNIVEKGPYRKVRHPSYTGILIAQVGIGLALRSLGAVLVILVIFAFVMGGRIRTEERFMLEHFPGYGEYMKRTKRLIPFLI